MMETTICHKCKGVLLDAHMGRQCPYCKEWTYTSLSEKALNELNGADLKEGANK